ncbi:arylsulfatase [Tamlana sp. 2_MG-2023]|uniref:arylsulfatase n=1 Tax=unclassified Tamlana TaxID=2614803 RepID=UPI0026E3B3A1|nr:MULTISPECIES: arylsulfatase [unclassified Tamlana]MDO6758658.1 arylsulfatase [Tamlana sp. 2_MG-2023]MDO6789357.1 arylsulfatase [Tamlana sp. 1_MG-2023]
MKKTQLLGTLLLCFISVVAFAQKKPNIVVIMGDDIGYWNLSYNNQGMMGYKTPNLDKLASEGTIFTDYYAEQSCTAGRAAFITGQMPIRTGMTKVGAAGATLGIQPEDPTLAELLKPLGYATGQFGKNHLGDRDEFLPTNHGFDEFFGNLYHLNAEETPELAEYPQNPEFRKKFGPRGVIHSTADGKIEDTGPLTKKRMETVDAEFMAAATKFVDKQVDADKPFFLWFNTTRMHYVTHVPEEEQGKTGLGTYADGMRQHDNQVGQLLEHLKAKGIEDNTIIVYTTDNGPHFNMWPDGGITPFRGEKNTNWEGGYRVPCIVKWPNKIPAGTVMNEIVAGNDWLPTLMAAAGEPNIKEKLLTGYKGAKRTFKVHLDGYNILPYLTGEKEAGKDKYGDTTFPRKEFYYWSDDGQLVAMRYQRWKLVFMEQQSSKFGVWMYPFVKLRIPLIFDLRMDPFERAQHNSNVYYQWMEEQVQWIVVPSQTVAGKMISTFKDFPPRQKPASFNLDEVMASFTAGGH